MTVAPILSLAEELTDCIPPELATPHQWVCWKYEERNGRQTKTPIQARNPKYHAKSNDPATWASLEAACEAYEDPDNGLNGVGRTFVEDEAGIDLDDSLIDEYTLKPWAIELLAEIPPTYTEISPSGKGVKLWLRSDGFDGAMGHTKYHDGAVEVYSPKSARYFTVTGRRFNDAPRTVATEAPEVLHNLIATVRGRRSAADEDAPLFNREREVVDPADLHPSDPVHTTIDTTQPLPAPRASVVRTLQRLGRQRWEDYDTWLKIGMALKEWDTREGLELWDGFSKIVAPTKYTNGICKEKWLTFKRGHDKLTLGTVHRWADEDTPVVQSSANAPEVRPTRFSVRTVADLAHIQPPRWVLQGEAIERGYHLIYGASGGGKTFYAIDRSLRLAAAGKHVLYIATEDLAGLRVRVAAWRKAHPFVTTETFAWLEMPEGLDLADQRQADELMAALQPYAFDHITIDTLREAHTGDENSSQDGAAVNRAVQALVRTGASVDVVHHSGVEDKRPRGTTAVFANADMVIRVGFDGDVVTVHTDKVRNSVQSDDRRYVLTPTDTGLTDTANQPIVSAILQLTDTLTPATAKLTRTHKAILELLAYSIFADTGAKTSQIIEVTGMSHRTAYRALSELKDKGCITQGSKGDPYTITKEGRAQLAPPTATADTAADSPTATTANELPPTDTAVSANQLQLPATATTLRGGSDGSSVAVTEEDIPVVPLADIPTEDITDTMPLDWNPPATDIVVTFDPSDSKCPWSVVVRTTGRRLADERTKDAAIATARMYRSPTIVSAELVWEGDTP